MLCSVFGKCLNMFGTTWVCELTSSTVHFMKSKSKSNICNENLLSKLRYALTMQNILLIIIFILIAHWNDNLWDIQVRENISLWSISPV